MAILRLGASIFSATTHKQELHEGPKHLVPVDLSMLSSVMTTFLVLMLLGGVNCFAGGPYSHATRPLTRRPFKTQNGMPMMVVLETKRTGKVAKALRRPSGGLTVSIEYRPTATNDIEEVRTLSAALRTMNTAVLWTADLEAIGSLVAEQERARGDFPGPCPVCFSGDSAQAEAAVLAGASAVVLDGSHDLSAADGLGVEVVWRVENEEEMLRVADAGVGTAFLVDGSCIGSVPLLHTAPKGSVVVAAIDAMQDAHAEIDLGKALVAEGCKALLVRGACVGDEEDLIYSQFVINRLTTKVPGPPFPTFLPQFLSHLISVSVANTSHDNRQENQIINRFQASSEFQIKGLTGAANGHFGTGGSFRSKEMGPWQRTTA